MSPAANSAFCRLVARMGCLDAAFGLIHEGRVWTWMRKTVGGLTLAGNLFFKLAHLNLVSQPKFNFFTTWIFTVVVWPSLQWGMMIVFSPTSSHWRHWSAINKFVNYFFWFNYWDIRIRNPKWKDKIRKAAKSHFWGSFKCLIIDEG